MNIAVVGGRDFQDFRYLEETILDNFKIKDIRNIVSGGAKGADSLGEDFANKYGLSKIIHYPDWAVYGRSAGFRRNALIINDADVVIAMWDGVSKGTANSIELAEKANKELIIKLY